MREGVGGGVDLPEGSTDEQIKVLLRAGKPINVVPPTAVSQVNAFMPPLPASDQRFLGSQLNRTLNIAAELLYVF